jgi:hypothetical protein
MRTTQTARLLLSGVASIALMGPAMALEAEAFIDRMTEVYRAVGYELSFGEATLDGDTITVDGVTVGIVGEQPDPESMVWDTEITFSGVTEGDDGSYSVDSATIPDIDIEFSSAPEPVGRLTVSDIRADGLYLPAGEDLSAQALMRLVESISTGPLSVTQDGEEVAAIESIVASSSFNPAEPGTELIDLDSTLAVNGIWIDLATIAQDDADSSAVIEALGLSTISGTITQDMSWSMADGHIVLNEFLFDFDQVGALDITADLTGLTPALLDQIYAMQAAMPSDGEMTEEQAQAQMMAGMALMQGVNIVGASVRYDDASLAGKLLDFFSAQSGTDRAAYVEGLKASLPALIGESGIPALVDLLVPPVSSFLDDPQSLELRVAPPSPTSLLVLMAAAANPGGLITALGLTVEANTAAE